MEDGWMDRWRDGWREGGKDVMRLSEPPRGRAWTTQTDRTMMQYAEHMAQLPVFSTLHYWHLGLDKPLLLGAVYPRILVTSSYGKWHPAKRW